MKIYSKKLNKNCLIIDLASSPGGVDFEAAKKAWGRCRFSSFPSLKDLSCGGGRGFFVNTCLSRLSEVSVNAVS